MPLQEIQRAKIADQLQKWALALRTKDARQVAALYAPDAVLLPTLSKEIRQSPAAIIDYFTHFLKLDPRAEVVQQTIRNFDQIATNSGIYKFITTINGAELVVMARFSFVYRKAGEDWQIIEHHSSMLPDA